MKKSKTLIKQQIIGNIKKGKLQIGSRLPAERSMVKQYGISRATLREILNSLVDEGILTRKQGSGTFVNSISTTNSSPIIGVMIPGMIHHKSIYVDIVHAMEKRLAEKGYTMMLCNHGNTIERAEFYINNFANLKIAGLAFVPMMLNDSEKGNFEIVNQIEKINLPFVIFDSQISSRSQGRYSYVGTDNYHAMRKLVRHLANLGHKRIAHIKGFDNVYSAQQRYDGYVDGLRKVDLEFRKEYVVPIKHQDVNLQGRAEVRNLLKLKEPPTAITCTHDIVAYNVIDEVRKMGLSVPEDLAVTGFDNINMHSDIYNILTTIAQPAEKEAEIIVDMLLDKIEGRLHGERQENIFCDLIVRSSCGANLKKSKLAEAI